MELKIAFGMIVFEGDYVLKECLEQVYPFASQILIAEGPVSYWQRQGKTTSTDEKLIEVTTQQSILISQAVTM
jgi:hypothetical protein